MVSHEGNLKALRTKLLGLSVVSVTASISATATGYARASGSFITDGFRVGMELTGTSFADSDNNAAKTLTAVTATALTCAGTAVEAAASVTLTVGLPNIRAWVNEDLRDSTGAEATKTQGEPYFEEQWVPGPLSMIGIGPTAQIEASPLYLPRIMLPQNTGALVAQKYADALVTLFAPGTSMTVGSDNLRVSGRPAPFPGQLLNNTDGWAGILVTIPLRLRTANSI